MSAKAEFHNLDDESQGLKTRIFPGDHGMLSVVTIDPNAQGKIHSHPQEQWGVLLNGDGVRIQDCEEIPVKAGDFCARRAACPTACAPGPRVRACSTSSARPGTNTAKADRASRPIRICAFGCGQIRRL